MKKENLMKITADQLPFDFPGVVVAPVETSILNSQ